MIKQRATGGVSMTARTVFLAGAVLIAGLSGAAQAADVAQGKTLVKTLCSNCHIVGPGEVPGTVNADIPSFMAVAAKPGQSAEKIRGFILNPHPDMPKVQLTKSELESVSAYIMSLKAGG
jgi:mono/diheme cytochrome c family protein